MKAQIQEIIERHLYTVSDSIEVCDNLGGQSIAADEIQALMCYREVGAYYLCLITYCSAKELSGWEKELIESFVKYYPETMIQEAINKVKSE